MPACSRSSLGMRMPSLFPQRCTVTLDHGIHSFRNLYIHKYILSRMRCGHHGSDYKKAEEFAQPV